MSEDPDNHARHGVRGILLLFAEGQRPDREAIRNFVNAQPGVALTLDPLSRPSLFIVNEGDTQQTVANSQAELRSKERVWVELLREGLTFDLVGLAPGKPVDMPEIEYRFDCGKQLSSGRAEAVQLMPGSHLSGGEASLPVLRALLALARDLVQHFEQVEVVAWPPSSSMIGRRFFESTTTAWLEGGVFPALGLTAFRQTIDGGLQSVGLSFLIGQELRIEPKLAIDKAAATRLGVRLINQLVLAGPVERAEQIIGPDGQRLQLDPSANRKFVRVWGG
ncbi:hypothetical protein G6N82_01840 [Altererythrobacter sp. BO-6]|nr:hypothetical protein G6N82_01840 [Altererythrobacter sp. BO-6]